MKSPDFRSAWNSAPAISSSRHPGSTVKLAPVVQAAPAIAADWHARGVDLYKAWRATWFKPAHLPAWVREVHSWQQLQINSPEENARVRYSDLVQYGEGMRPQRRAERSSWSAGIHGGQDRGNPSQETDPSLGTWQELHDAIAQIQAQGVRIILFGKFTWADLTTKWYQQELYKYASTDPYGIPYQTGGDSYLTPTQLAGINNRRFAIMDFLSPAYREIATKEFEKILQLGSAGWLYDEVCDRTVGKYNVLFAEPRIRSSGIYLRGRRAAGPPVARAAADRVSPEFLFAGEGPSGTG